MRTQTGLGGQRRVDWGALEAYEVYLAFIDGKGKRGYCIRGLRPKSPSTTTAVRMSVYLVLIRPARVWPCADTPGDIDIHRAWACRRASGRKVHSTSVPRVGGVAVVAAADWPSVVVRARGQPAGRSTCRHSDRCHPLSGALVFGVGLVDDLRHAFSLAEGGGATAGCHHRDGVGTAHRARHAWRRRRSSA